MLKTTMKWILPLSLAFLICAGCSQSNSKVVSKAVPDFSQMPFADVKEAADKGDSRAQEVCLGNSGPLNFQ
jgi:hypothetical protein